MRPATPTDPYQHLTAELRTAEARMAAAATPEAHRNALMACCAARDAREAWLYQQNPAAYDAHHAGLAETDYYR